MKMLKEIKLPLFLSPSYYKEVLYWHRITKKNKAEERYIKELLSQEFSTVEEIEEVRRRINKNRIIPFLLSEYTFKRQQGYISSDLHNFILAEEYLNNCEARLKDGQSTDEFEVIRNKLINLGFDMAQINKFLVLYSIIQKRFPDYKRVHKGFLSAIDLDIVNPQFDYHLTNRGEIRNRVSKLNYNFSKHIDTMSMIIDLESQTLPQRVLRFRQLYNPRDQGLSELEKDSISISELEGRLQKQKDSGNKKDFRQHDLVLPTYLKLRSQKTIDSIIIGDTISTFLNLDPDLQTVRCTAGNGIFRKTTYQYALLEDISVIDLCFNTPENKIAEVITVNAKDKDKNHFLVVETAEAGDDAFLLPDYKGMPAWTYLLLEEVVDRAHNSGSKLVFTTNLDFKPATNMFVTTAAKMLGFAKNIPDSEKYKPRFREEPLKYDEFLTTIRWRGHKESKSIYLEKEVEGVVKEMVFTPVSFGPFTIFAIILNYISKELWDYDFMDKLENRERVVQDTLHNTGMLPETYLGAWKKPFYYRGHPNINNGQGFVDGFEYEVTKEKYEVFKQEMDKIKEHLGLII